MPFYHATWDRHLPSILRNGLGGSAPDRKNFDCEDGLYLATDPSAALLILIEAAMIDSGPYRISPREANESMRLIVIDDSRIEACLCIPDPNLQRKGIAFIYKGVVDVRGMPVINMDTAMKALPSHVPDVHDKPS
ncbi:hypothetical protein [Rhizobium sp. Root482]|uniref:hypothetical protein n=1 Tax=Rhizobium sp. Root482 TaxID=1736543 RepID=UPI0006F3824A|nr:hypothetical protein [Rhizobium sp. Root482]KQY20306.1 hypothetical protein ASD31_24175 [Rhizobium sp. Root482]